MLSLTRSISSHTPKSIVRTGATRFFGLGEDLLRKEKVEEDRFIRSKEHEDYLRRKAEEAPVAELSQEEAAAKKAHEDAFDEAFKILSANGCKVSDETIEALADWKLGKK